MNSVKRKICRVEFSAIADIQPERDAAGYIVEDNFQLGPDVRHNKYSDGPFCRFRVAQSITSAGVYALTVGDQVMYIGECENLAKRYSSTGYGRISPRNCHSDGQSTNCKINSLVLRHTKAGQTITLWFHQTEEYKWIEATLIQELSPPWNGRLERGALQVAEAPARVKPSEVPSPAQDKQTAVQVPVPEKPVAVLRPAPIPRETKTREWTPTPIAIGFRDALSKLLADANSSGQSALRVRAGDLHRKVGGHPGAPNRMPVCCSVMRRMMTPGDIQIQAPPKGDGGNLVIEYRLPRQ